MGDKNSYFPSFGGCQAISEIKQVGSSNDTTALVPRQAFLSAARGFTHAHLLKDVREFVFDAAVYKYLFPSRQGSLLQGS